MCLKHICVCKHQLDCRAYLKVWVGVAKGSQDCGAAAVMSTPHQKSRESSLCSSRATPVTDAVNPANLLNVDTSNFAKAVSCAIAFFET